MPSPFLYLDGDLALGPGATPRLATDLEAIAQSVDHLLDDLDTVGDPGTAQWAADARAAILDMLGSHPRVSSIEGVTVTPNADDTASIEIAVNGQATSFTR
jgi:hypothetical protein